MALKDRNRGLILLLLEKIKESGDKKYIPFLQQWEKIDYKKVREAIRDVIQQLQEGRGIDLVQADLRERNFYGLYVRATRQPSAPVGLVLTKFSLLQKFVCWILIV